MEKKKTARLAAMLLAVLLLAGCGGGQEPAQSAEPEDHRETLEAAVLESMDAAAYETVEEVRVTVFDGEYKVSIRTYLGDGTYFPAVIEQTAGPVFDKAEELGITLGEYQVMEYTKTNSGDMLGLISWKSEDGVTGIYADDSGEEPVILPGMTVEDIRERVE